MFWLVWGTFLPWQTRIGALSIRPLLVFMMHGVMVFSGHLHSYRVAIFLATDLLVKWKGTGVALFETVVSSDL